MENSCSDLLISIKQYETTMTLPTGYGELILSDLDLTEAWSKCLFVDVRMKNNAGQ